MLEYLESIVTLWQTQDWKKLALSITVQLLENFVLWAGIPEEDSDCVS